MAVPVGMPDHALLTRARDGDGEAFEALYRRHHRAATRAAHSYSSRSQLAEDAVQEAFLRILHATQEGGGPTTEFRAYLATTVRHVIAGWTRGERTIVSDDLEVLAGEDVREGSRPESRLRWHLLTKAFKSLPTRWQEALWLGEVEGIAPAELAKRWNMSPNSAAALCYRARDGLRTAWLDAHVNEGLVPDECRPYVSDLSRFTQGKLTDRREKQVRTHLEDCDYCRAVLFEVDAAATELRVLLLPVALWGGLALAGAGLALGPLKALGKTLTHLGPRGIAVGAASTATVVAVVIAALSPALSDPPGSTADGGRPLVTFTDPSDDETSQNPDPDDADEPAQPPDDAAAEEESAATGSAPDETETVTATDPTADPTTTAPVAPPSTTPPAQPTQDPTQNPGTDPGEDDSPAPAPGAPELSHHVADGAIEIYGTGEPGATVTVAVADGGTSVATGGAGATGRAVMPRGPVAAPGAALATATVASDGTWSVTPDLDAVAGLTVVATQTLEGRRSPASGPIALPSRPAAPIIVMMGTSGTSVELTGAGLPGSTVEIALTSGDALLGTPVDEHGAWMTRFALTADLGGAQVVAVQIAHNGLSSPGSVPFELPGYEPPPVQVPPLATLTLAAERAGGQIVLSGSGEPGAAVTVVGNRLPPLSATVDEHGAWSASTRALPEFAGDVVVATQTLDERTSESGPATIPEFSLPAAPGVWRWDYIPFVDEVVIFGDGVPGAAIVMRDADGVQVGQSRVDGGLGTWSLGLDAENIPDGGLTVTFHQVVDGLESPAGRTITLEADRIPLTEEPVADQA